MIQPYIHAFKSSAAVAAVTAIATLTGCAGTPHYENAFKGQPTMKNSRTYSVGQAALKQDVEQTLAARGFRVQSDSENHIEAINNFKDKQNSNQVSIITADIGFIPVTPNRTTISMVADQKTVLHKTYHTYFHLLWILPIFPTGTHHKQVVLDASTIKKDSFYQDFFKDLQHQT